MPGIYCLSLNLFTLLCSYFPEHQNHSQEYSREFILVLQIRFIMHCLLIHVPDFAFVKSKPSNINENSLLPYSFR